MPKSAFLRVCDVRALLRLVGECRELGDDPLAWRQHWLRRTATLIGADLMVGGEMAGGPNGVRGGGVTDWGWENGFDKAVWEKTMSEQPDLRFSPFLSAYFGHTLPDDSACLSRTDLVSNLVWERSDYYQQSHRPVGLGHTMFCCVPIAGLPGLSALSVSKAAGTRRDFSGRDKVLMREISLALGELVGGALASFSAPSAAGLPPRVRAVLRCLLEGDSDKLIAARLEISRHTVNQYTKVLFRHFGVQSRSELMARWIRRRFGGR